MKYYDLHFVESFPDRPWIGGYAKRWKIYILERLRGDLGIFEHELCHVRQWWFTLGFHSLLYRFSDRYKLWAEIQAYKVQLEYSPKNRELFAKYIATRYDLDITWEEAYVRLG